jgi:aminopeptidase N
MHRDAEISTSDFMQIALSGLKGETDDAIVSIVLSQLTTSVEAFAKDTNRDAYREKLADALWQLANEAKPAGDLQLIYTRAFAANAFTQEQISNLRAVLNGSITGLKVDTDLRWYLLIALTERGATDKSELEAELAKDNTTTGNIAFETALAAFPTSEAKAYAFNKVRDDSAATSIRSALVSGFQRPSHRHLLTPFVDLYFDNLLTEWDSKSYEGAAKFVSGMYPSWVVSDLTVNKTNAWLNGAGKDAPVVLRKLVKESQDGLIRALKVQKLDK